MTIVTDLKYDKLITMTQLFEGLFWDGLAFNFTEKCGQFLVSLTDSVCDNRMQFFGVDSL